MEEIIEFVCSQPPDIRDDVLDWLLEECCSCEVLEQLMSEVHNTNEVLRTGKKE